MHVLEFVNVHKSVVAGIALFLSLFVNASAQLDPTFGTNGVTTAFPGQNAGPVASFVLPDGKIFVVGRSGCCGGGSPGTTFFFRFNSDGSPDTTYSATGYKTITAGSATRGAARQPDGKLVLVGRDHQYG